MFLADSLSRLNLSAVAESKTQFNALAGRVRQTTAYKAAFSGRIAKDLTPDGFDEDKFTDAYFSKFEIDIADEDEGFGIFENGDSEGENDDLGP
jgi:hypothetical protein